MSRPLAMWIERAYETRVRGHRYHLSGPILGRAPEMGDALMLRGLFDDIPMRCRQLIGEARGGEGALFTLGVDPLHGLNPARLRGAFLVEDGVVCRRFGTLLRGRRPALRTTARFELRDGHAWGLVSIRADALNVVVVGGGLGHDALWSVLKEIRLESGEILASTELAPQAGLDHATLWRLRAVKSYVRSDASRAFVVPAVGPVVSEQRPLVLIAGRWHPAHMHQQSAGAAQFLIPDAAEESSESLVELPMAA